MLVATPVRHWWAYVLAAYFTSVINDVRAGFPISAVFFIAAASSVKTAAFRIAQEAVTNVLRHASAGNVWVSLASDPSNLELRVRDDGLGFDLLKLRRSQALSFGLSSMEERVRLVGGQIEIVTSPGAGTEVWARFPTP